MKNTVWSYCFLNVVLHFSGSVSSQDDAAALTEKLLQNTNCLHAAQSVQKDPADKFKTAKFLGDCSAFLQRLSLTEEQTQVLQRLGFTKSNQDLQSDGRQSYGQRETELFDGSSHYTENPSRVPSNQYGNSNHFQLRKDAPVVNMEQLMRDIDMNLQAMQVPSTQTSPPPPQMGLRIQQDGRLPRHQFQSPHEEQLLSQNAFPTFPREMNAQPPHQQQEQKNEFLRPHVPHAQLQENFRQGEQFHLSFQDRGQINELPEKVYEKPLRRVEDGNIPLAADHLGTKKQKHRPSEEL